MAPAKPLALAFGAIIALISFDPALANTSADDANAVRMREIYGQILRDPSNADLNIRYANLAITQGELRKAIAAYERILSRDPDNEQAQRGLRRVQRMLEPDFTRVGLTFGANYENNPFRANQPGDDRHDGVLFLQAQVIDERGVDGTIRWRTRGQVYANWHFLSRDLDFGLLTAGTGPVIPVTEDWQIYVHAGGGYAWFDQRTFFAEANGGFTVESTDDRILRSIAFRIRHDFIAEAFSGRDALIFDVTGQFVVEQLFFESDFTVFGPYYRYNGVLGSGSPTLDQRGDEFPQRFHQIGLRIDQFTRLAERITGNVNATFEYRHYFEQVTVGTQNRRDIYFAPGAQIIFTGFPIDGVDLILSYTFEWNVSNDGFQNYTNHIAGFRLLWRL